MLDIFFILFINSAQSAEILFSDYYCQDEVMREVIDFAFKYFTTIKNKSSEYVR